MERLEAKQVKGHTYYYYSKWAWVDNRCRRVWQKYLGKLEDIVAAVHGGGPAPVSAEVFQWGLDEAASPRDGGSGLGGLCGLGCDTLGFPAVVAGILWPPTTKGYHDVRTQ